MANFTVQLSESDSKHSDAVQRLVDWHNRHTNYSVTLETMCDYTCVEGCDELRGTCLLREVYGVIQEEQGT